MMRSSRRLPERQVSSLTTDYCSGCSGSSDRGLVPVAHSANQTDWDESYSSQSYQVYRCQECESLWGCRHQYDAGTGHDDRWYRFGPVDPATIERHY
jgi:hypothetical protein